MKVFLANLLFVGLAAAASSSSKSIVESLKADLDLDVESMKLRSKDLVQKVYSHIQEDVDAFLISPDTISTIFIEHLTFDAQDTINSANADIRTMKYHIEKATSELTPTDVVLKDILDKLLERLDDVGRDAELKKDQLLHQTTSHILDDIYLVVNNVPNARDIVVNHVNEDYDIYVGNVKDFVVNIEKYVADAYAELKVALFQ